MITLRSSALSFATTLFITIVAIGTAIEMGAQFSVYLLAGLAGANLYLGVKSWGRYLMYLHGVDLEKKPEQAQETSV